MKPRRLVEAAAAGIARGLAGSVSARTAYALGRGLGSWIFPLLGRPRRIALLNLGAARGVAATPWEARRIARAATGHFVGALFEAGAALRDRRALDDVHFEGLQRLEVLLSRGRGVIAVLAHMGNWELAGMAAARHGYPIIAVARPIHNPLLDGLARRLRERAGLATVPRRGSIPALLEALRENRIVVLVADQHHRGGLEVAFFAQRCLATPTPAVLALRTGAPILPLFLHRADRPPLHRVLCDDPIEPDTFRGVGDPAGAITQEIARRLESFIRRVPEQWLWLHNRWRWAPPRRAVALAPAACTPAPAVLSSRA